LSAYLAESQFVLPSKRCVSGQQFCSAANPLDPPPTWQQLIQRLFDLGGTKNQQQYFSNRANSTFAH
jgi:hypothetical protein